MIFKDLSSRMSLITINQRDLLKPFVSIIIPSFNHSKYIEKLLISIKNQSFTDYETIIVDDCSTDGSQELLLELQKSYKFQFHQNTQNLGICATLNNGIGISRGELLVCIASDDQMTLNRLESQISYFQDKPEIDFVAGGVNFIDPTGENISTVIPEIVGEIKLDHILIKNPIFAPTVMMRKSVFEKFGPYPENVSIEDLYMWLKASIGGAVIVNTPEIWAKYTVERVEPFSKKLWYYRGALEVLNFFKDVPKIKRALTKREIKFCVLYGLKGAGSIFKIDSFAVKKINVFLRSLSLILSILPTSLKNFIFSKLSKSER